MRDPSRPVCMGEAVHAGSIQATQSNPAACSMQPPPPGALWMRLVGTAQATSRGTSDRGLLGRSKRRGATLRWRSRAAATRTARLIKAPCGEREWRREQEGEAWPKRMRRSRSGAGALSRKASSDCLLQEQQTHCLLYLQCPQNQTHCLLYLHQDSPLYVYRPGISPSAFPFPAPKSKPPWPLRLHAGDEDALAQPLLLPVRVGVQRGD
jgi:hypothetical protein